MHNMYSSLNQRLYLTRSVITPPMVRSLWEL